MNQLIALHSIVSLDVIFVIKYLLIHIFIGVFDIIFYDIMRSVSGITLVSGHDGLNYRVQSFLIGILLQVSLYFFHSELNSPQFDNVSFSESVAFHLSSLGAERSDYESQFFAIVGLVVVNHLNGIPVVVLDQTG